MRWPCFRLSTGANTPLDLAQGSAFADVPLIPPDAIFHVKTAFGEDTDPSKVSCWAAPRLPVGSRHPGYLGDHHGFLTRPNPCLQVNLGIGAYRTEEGKPWVLPAVRLAEEELVADPALSHEYLPIRGSPAFIAAAQELVFADAGSVLADRRVRCGSYQRIPLRLFCRCGGGCLYVSLFLGFLVLLSALKTNVITLPLPVVTRCELEAGWVNAVLVGHRCAADGLHLCARSHAGRHRLRIGTDMGQPQEGKPCLSQPVPR